MNNNQFRRLLFDSSDGQNAAEGSTHQTPPAGSRPSLTPMTPRTVKNNLDSDFVRQVRERNAAFRPTRQFKSVAPKGVKYGAGYTDRARERAGAEEGTDANDKANRIRALEEQMKLGQISEDTFEELRDQITGGDVRATHLVKGLDRKLLERVKRGEDVLGTGSGQGPSFDVEEELEKLGEKEVEAVRREKLSKKGSLISPAPVAGVKRSRDEIMAELKAQRKAAAEAKAVPALDRRWKKVGEKEVNRIEIDYKGREVLITVDEDGMVKRKVRKGPEQSKQAMPDSTKPVLGADAVVPHLQSRDVPEEEKDDDIFEGVGTEYNPLGVEVESEDNDSDDNDDDDDDDDDDIDDNDDEEQNREYNNSDIDDDNNSDRETGIADGKLNGLREMVEVPPDLRKSHEDEKADRSTPQTQAGERQNYFRETLSDREHEKDQDRFAGVQDLLKKAAKMDPLQTSDEVGVADGREQKLREARRAEMLAQHDRDFDDMDMGFGSSRYDDGEDEGDGAKARLSEWKGKAGGDEGWAEDGKGDGGKKKRRAKKRKGDVNNVSDIMRVIEGRKANAEK